MSVTNQGLREAIAMENAYIARLKKRVAELEAENAALKLSHKGGDEICVTNLQPMVNALAETRSASSEVVSSNAEPENVPPVSDSATLEDGK